MFDLLFIIFVSSISIVLININLIVLKKFFSLWEVVTMSQINFIYYYIISVYVEILLYFTLNIFVITAFLGGCCGITHSLISKLST